MTEKNEHIVSLLQGIDADPLVIDAVMRLDAVMQTWRRKMTKRELGRRAIEKLNLPVEQIQLDGLFAIAAPLCGSGIEASSETMVATVAERLSIDPSRASRIISDLVKSGYARRAVSQEDARRTIVELTERGHAITQAVRSYRSLMLADYLSGWATEDIAAFVPMLERYTDWFDDVADSEARLSQELSNISQSAAKAETPSGSRSKIG